MRFLDTMQAMVPLKRFTSRLGFIYLSTVLAATALAGQSSRQPTKVMDTSALHPPAGANVAIVEFSDLECPACARANPILMQAVAQYKIPWVRRDLIIPSHPWSPTAAVNARWFDSKGNGLGDSYRNAVFANQSSIYNVNVLATFTQNFAQSHGVAMPFSVDPQGKLAAAVKADTDLGMHTGVTLTPTIFVVTAHSKGAPYIEVLNPETDLFRNIDQALADTKQPAAAHHK
jgi:protein-disulfide isomerase